MKVLVFVTQFYQLGGAERLAVELTADLHRLGYCAHLLSMYSAELPGTSEAEKILRSRGIENISFLGLRVHPSMSTFLGAILRLRNLLKQGGYDVIETSSLTSTVLASWATIGTSTRHIAGIHHVYRRQVDNTLQQRLLRYSMRLNQGTLFYAVSDYTKAAWVSYAGVAASRCRTIYNAIMDENFEALPARSRVAYEQGIDVSARILLFVGRLAKYKGCDVVLDAFTGIAEQENLYLLFVGEVDPSVNGSREMVVGMTRLIKSQGLEARVRFLGYRTDVPILMASADVLVHPTEKEAFGLAPVEALASGLPVIATAVEGIPEVLEGSGSIIVQPNSSNEVRAAVLTVFNRSAEEVAKVRVQGRAVAAKYRRRRRVDNFLGFFKESG